MSNRHTTLLIAYAIMIFILVNITPEAFFFQNAISTQLMDKKVTFCMCVLYFKD